MRRAITVLAFCLTGCHYWLNDPAALTQPIPERDRVEIWTRGQSYEAHGVRTRGDSLRFVPYWRPPDCDSCATILPLAAVDSIRVQRPDETRTAITAVLVTAYVAFSFWVMVTFSGYRD